jgi:hypothetical protein
MILSKENIFSDKQEIVASAPSQNVIDTGKGGIDLGWGTPASLLVQLTRASGGAPDITVMFQASDDPGFATSETVFSETLPAASFAVGARITHSIVPYNVKRRFVRLMYFVPSFAPDTEFSVTAGITYGNDETAPY